MQEKTLQMVQINTTQNNYTAENISKNHMNYTSVVVSWILHLSI
jgi:hypothetical protein